MLADLVDYLLHQRFRLLQPAVEQDQTELVTAQPSGQSLLRSWCRISWAMSRSSITRRVAGGVVYRFEPIQIEEHQRMRRRRFPAGGDRRLQLLLEAGAVRQAGQRVVRGAVAELFISSREAVTSCSTITAPMVSPSSVFSGETDCCTSK